jgi:hypothetical protein
MDILLSRTLVQGRIVELLGASRRAVFRDRGNIRNQGDNPKNFRGGCRHCSMTIEAISPWDGDIDFMTTGKMNSKNISLFLDQISTVKSS